MSGSGGKRAGAGRPAGALNKVGAEKRAAIVASGLTPLDYMLRRLRDDTTDHAVRLDAAKAAAPYIHPRLAALTVSGDAEHPVITEVRIVIVPSLGHSNR